ncbi:MAG: hypothetical protein HOP12_04100, partial [Candidatus Eisenbacteria bacterium]|nr:hypothetical protein [Candidatus Eisenbacteria bacterium]
RVPAARRLHAATNGRHPVPSSDPATYDQVAWNLARGLGFSLGSDGATWPTAFVPPLVPFWISQIYRVAGHDPFLALLVQCAIGALVPLLIGRLAAALYGSSVARLTGWIVTLDPLLIFFSGYLLTETTFSATLALAMLASVAWVKTPRSGRAVGVGLLWGLASLSRPTALLLPAALALWAWVPLGLALTRAARIRQLALMALGLAVVVGPWTLRNAIELRAFVLITTGQGRALLDSNNPLVWDDPAQRGNAVTVYQREPWSRAFRGRSEPEVDRLASGFAIEYLRANASRWPAMAVAKVSRMWRVTREGGARDWSGGGAWLARLRFADPLLLWSLPLFACAVIGLAFTVRGPRRWFQLSALGPLIYFTLLATLYWGALRVRVPVQPLIAIYAAAGVDALVKRGRVRASGLTVIEGRSAAAR